MSSRPKLTPLSALMPQKGEATRPEQVIERAREPAREQAGEHVSNHAVAEFNNRTVADFPPAASAVSLPAREHVSPLSGEPEREIARERPAVSERELSSGLADERVSKRAGERASRLTNLDDSAEYIDGPRSSVSFRMTERLKDRLRDYAHFSRRQKQDIMDQAVHEFLRREGY